MMDRANVEGKRVKEGRVRREKWSGEGLAVAGAESWIVRGCS